MDGICVFCFDPHSCSINGGCNRDSDSRYLIADDWDDDGQYGRDDWDDDGQYGQVAEDDPWRHVDAPEW